MLVAIYIAGIATGFGAGLALASWLGRRSLAAIEARQAVYRQLYVEGMLDLSLQHAEWGAKTGHRRLEA